MTFINYFTQKYRPMIRSDVSILYRDQPKEGGDNNLGELYGVDLESGEYAGYIYYWGKGCFDFFVISLTDMEVVVPVTILDVSDFKEDAIIEKIVNYFV